MTSVSVAPQERERAIADLRASRQARRDLIQTSDGRRHSRRQPSEVITALKGSFRVERNARALGLNVPPELEIRYRDVAKLASICGLPIDELLRATGPG